MRGTSPAHLIPLALKPKDDKNITGNGMNLFVILQRKVQ
jgi:hypothetical protein